MVVEYDPGVTGVSLTSSCKEVNVGWSGYISATVYPSSAPNRTVYWSSSNPNVASVDRNSGLICTKLAGSTVITATTADGGYTATCTLTVSLTDKQLSEQIMLCFSLLTEYSSYAYLPPMQYAALKGLDSEEAAIEEQTELVQSIQLVNFILLENKLVASCPTASRTIATHILSGEKYDVFEQADITADIRNHSAVFDEVWKERNKQSWLELAQFLIVAGTMIPYVQIPASLILLGQGIVGKDLTGRQLSWWERALNITSGAIAAVDSVMMIKAAVHDLRLAKSLRKVATLAGDNNAINVANTIDDAAASGSNAELLFGDEWYQYFQNTYGAQNVTWKGTSFEQIVKNPSSLYGSTQSEIARILGAGWTSGTYGSSGLGWKFTKGDLSVFYHPGNGVHAGPYYGFSSGLTGKTKVVSTSYVSTIDDSANIIFLPYWS